MDPSCSFERPGVFPPVVLQEGLVHGERNEPDDEDVKNDLGDIGVPAGHVDPVADSRVGSDELCGDQVNPGDPDLPAGVIEEFRLDCPADDDPDHFERGGIERLGVPDLVRVDRLHMLHGRAAQRDEDCEEYEERFGDHPDAEAQEIFNKQVYTDIMNTKDEFLNEAAPENLFSPDMLNELWAGYDEVFKNNEIISIVGTNYFYTGGAHGMQLVYLLISC